MVKLTGKITIGVYLPPSCPLRGMEPGNVMRRRESRRRLYSHPALQGRGERLEALSTTPLQGSQHDSGGDKEFKIEHLNKALNHINFQ